MIKNIQKLILVAALVAFPLFNIGVANAATPSQPTCTDTWTGSTSDSWATASNWSSNAVPGSSDVVCIDNSNLGSAVAANQYVIANVSGSIVSLVFENDAPAGANGAVALDLTGTLGITNLIYQSASDTNTLDNIAGTSTSETVALNGNATFVTSNGGGLDFGDGSGSSTPDVLSLGANTLTFDDQGGTDSGTEDDLDSTITGTGSLVFDSPATSYEIFQDNNYVGTTTITATGESGVVNDQLTAFSTSAVNVASGNSITYDYTGTTGGTIGNNFTFAGHTSVSDSSYPDFAIDNVDDTPGLTINVPNITLDGSVKFANEADTNADLITVNLAGINANGNCVIYGGATSTSDDAASNGFENGPTVCATLSASTTPSTSTPTAATTKTPGTPDTGSSLTEADVLLPLVASGLIAGGLYVISKKDITLPNIKLR